MLNKPTHEVELVYYGTTGTIAQASIKKTLPYAPNKLQAGMSFVLLLQSQIIPSTTSLGKTSI